MSNLVLENQFGEVSDNVVIGGDADLSSPIAAGTVLSNVTGGSAVPIGNTLATISTKLPAKSGVTAISAESAAGAITIALSTSNTYTDAAVNTAVNTALTSVVTQLNAIITQANALLAALKATS